MFSNNTSYFEFKIYSTASKCAYPPAQNKPNVPVQFDYQEASVLLITSWNNGPEYVLLGRESCGPSKGEWDNFGGGKDHGDNNNYLTTATRELQEETIYLLGLDNNIRNILQNSEKVTNDFKKSVTYIAYFNHQIMENLTRNFYNALAKTGKKVCKEKDALAWVKYEDLKNVINNAPRDSGGHLITPIIINGKLVNKNNPSLKGQIPISLKLRPFFVSKIQGKI